MAVTKATQINRDAAEFGAHCKQGGWRLGLLVARNVIKAEHGGSRSKGTSSVESNGKIGVKEFAEKAGVTDRNVRYYYDAWELAADDGKCQHAADLFPGDEDASIELDDEDDEMRFEWSKYLKKVREPKETKTQAKANLSVVPDSQENEEDEDEDATILDLQELTGSTDEEEDDEPPAQIFGTGRTDILLDIKEAIVRNIELLEELGEPQDEKETELMNEIHALLADDPTINDDN